MQVGELGWAESVHCLSLFVDTGSHVSTFWFIERKLGDKMHRGRPWMTLSELEECVNWWW